MNKKEEIKTLPEVVAHLAESTKHLAYSTEQLFGTAFKQIDELNEKVNKIERLLRPRGVDK